MHELKTVSTLKTVPEQDREKVAELVQELFDAHARGEVSEVLFAYTQPDGTSSYAVSGNMTVQRLAYLVAVLQWRLNRWLD